MGDVYDPEAQRAPEIIRAVVESYDYTTHRANVRPAGQPEALMVNVPVARSLFGELIAEGHEVGLVNFHDGYAFVAALYNALPVWPPHLHAYNADVWVCSRADGNPQYYPDIEEDLTITVPSYLWFFLCSNAKPNNDAQTLINIKVEEQTSDPKVALAPFSYFPGISGKYQNLVLAARDVNVWSPGTYTFKLRIYWYINPGSIEFRYTGVNIFAFPADPGA